MGRSYNTKREVNIVLAEALPGTIILALAAMTHSHYTRHIIRYSCSAQKRYTWLDTSAIAASVAGISMPSFFAGLLIAYCIRLPAS